MASLGRKRGTRTDAQARMALGIRDLLSGRTHAQIAEAHGVTRRQVRRWAEQPEVREAIDRAKTDALEHLQLHGLRAAEVLAELLSDEDAKIRQTTATAILDRTGLPKTERLEHDDVSAPKDIAEARARIDEWVRKAGGAPVVWDAPANEEADDGDE
jgi:hypothetical protein